MQGLELSGFDPMTCVPWWGSVRPGDVLVIWNRYGEVEVCADKFEKEGGRVIVAENGYLGAGGIVPKDDEGAGRYIALAWHAHNGRGRWPDGDASRFDALGVRVRPWQTDGEYVLICGNRSFGMRGGVMPLDWVDATAAEYKAKRMDVRVRYHPGNFRSARTLAEDLAGAYACVIWSSSCGVHALLAGVPVVCDSPFWICKPASFARWYSDMKNPDENRLNALHRMAWAQWTINEIATGKAFEALCGISTPAATATA